MRQRQQFSDALRQVGGAAFGLFLFLSLITPSWRYGPFALLPLWEYELLAGAPMSIGIANFLPIFVFLSVTISRILIRRPWSWGPLALTLPLLGLTLIGVLHIDLVNFRLAFLHVGMFSLAWFVYLYIINERPRLILPIALILIVQGFVAIGQFLTQRDLGLELLGELPLHPAFEGNSVLWARGQPWLRAYGLTAHPNLLGSLLTALLLFILPALSRSKGWVRAGLVFAAMMGTAGLFLSFSRGSWLGMMAGLAALWLFGRMNRRPSPQFQFSSKFGRRWLLALIPLAVLLIAYSDLVFSRFFALDTPTEAQSINQRLHDAALAVEVIRSDPLRGVGLGYYIDAAQSIDPDAARVHNVGLLVMAELGLPGLFFWLWLMSSPFMLLPRGWQIAPSNERTFHFSHVSAQLAPWVAMLVVNTFDTMLWLSSNWQTSILFALLLVNVVYPIGVKDSESDNRRN